MLTVRELTPQDEAAFLKGAGEWSTAELNWHSFEWRPGVEFAWLLERLKKNAAGVDIPAQFVPSSMLYGFTPEGEIVGRISIRHRLNENLRERGGHIGYAVAPRFRRKGYANELMQAGLAHARKTGLTEVLVTCADDNEASWRVIERAGGRLQDRVHDKTDNELIRRYTISL